MLGLTGFVAVRRRRSRAVDGMDAENDFGLSDFDLATPLTPPPLEVQREFTITSV